MTDKEKYNQIIDGAYENYNKEIIRQRKIQKEEVDRLRSQGKRVRVSLIELLSKEEFINKCKADFEFSEKWGLKVVERELNLDERAKLHSNPEMFYEINGTHFSISDNIENSNFPNDDKIWLHKQFDKGGIPTKLITVTYNNETIESYEY